MCTPSTVRLHGPLVLWSGVRPALLMAVPSTALYFTAYDVMRERLTRRWAGTPAATLAPLLAGGVARTIVALLFSPLELVRTQMQAVRTNETIGAALRREVR